MIGETSSKATGENGINSISNDVSRFEDAETEVYGNCVETKSPEQKEDLINFVQIVKGSYFNVSIPPNYFTDFEDGGMSNLTLCIKDDQNRRLDTTSWIKVNEGKICGVYTLNEQQNRISTNKLVRYSLVAKDGCGK